MLKHGNVVVAFSTPISCGCGHLDSYSYSQQVHVPPYALKYRIGRRSFVSGDTCEYISLLTSSRLGQRQLRHNNYRLGRSGRARIRATIDVASAVDVINDLGLDTLTFLAVTVAVVPTFKLLKASPILGFFFAGVVLNQFGFIRNLTDVKVLSEWGILFLLFEMGLELSFARLKALAKFAFGMGLTQLNSLSLSLSPSQEK